MIRDIESQSLCVELDSLLPKVADIKVSNFIKRIKECDNYQVQSVRDCYW